MGETSERPGSVATGPGDETSVLERVAFVPGTAAAVGAYLLSYLVTYVTQSAAVRDRLAGLNFVAGLFGGDPVAAWQAVGWYLYNAHFVATVVPSLGGGTRAANLLASADANLGYLYLVPPLALLAAGAAVARVADARDARDGAVAALGTVPAYFLLAIAGAFVFAYGAGDAGSIHPEYVTAALLAGLVYPAVFGSVGGAVGGLLGDG
ncbi:transporter [Halobaculum litoreum]|uniref:Transporter n=1 Tax=Halobaculum litoreum TaxID=3031998 RepID=A0ABD5XPT4_9EURY|nr:transporter [Halobaculum sp. DT92]